MVFLVVAIPQILISKAFFEHVAYLAKDKLVVLGSLRDDFGIRDYETYRSQVTFVGFGHKMGFNRDGFDSLFYLDGGAHEGAGPIDRSRHVLVVKKSEIGPFERHLNKLGTIRQKDFERSRIIEYELSQGETCETRCIVSDQRVEGRDGLSIRLVAELDVEAEALFLTFSSPSAVTGPFPLKLLYERGHCTDLLTFRGGAKQGERIDLVPLVDPEACEFRGLQCYLKKGFNVLGIQFLSERFSHGVAYILFEIS